MCVFLYIFGVCYVCKIFGFVRVVRVATLTGLVFENSTAVRTACQQGLFVVFFFCVINYAIDLTPALQCFASYYHNVTFWIIFVMNI